MSPSPDVPRFDMTQLNPTRLREIAKTAKGHRFLIDQRAAVRMERDRIEARSIAQLAEFDAMIKLLAMALGEDAA